VGIGVSRIEFSEFGLCFLSKPRDSLADSMVFCEFSDRLLVLGSNLGVAVLVWSRVIERVDEFGNVIECLKTMFPEGGLFTPGEFQ
jgi:hypothetical protein